MSFWNLSDWNSFFFNFLNVGFINLDRLKTSKETGGNKLDKQQKQNANISMLICENVCFSGFVGSN